MRFNKNGTWHKDFGYFKKWCKQHGKKPSDPNVLTEFINGLPLYEDSYGELYMSHEINVAYSMKYGSYYNEKLHEETNCSIGECLVEEVLA